MCATLPEDLTILEIKQQAQASHCETAGTDLDKPAFTFLTSRVPLEDQPAKCVATDTRASSERHQPGNVAETITD